MQRQTLDTSSVRPHQMLDYWNDVVCQSFVELECTSLIRARKFHGSVENHNLENLQLSRVISCPQHVKRSTNCLKGSDSDVFLLSLQTRGQGIISQDGRNAHLGLGDFALYDTTRKYTLHFEHEFSQLVLRLPRRVAEKYLVSPAQMTARKICGASGAGKLFRSLLTSVADEYAEMDRHLHGDIEQTVTGLLGMAFSDVTGGIKPAASSAKHAVLMRVRDHILDNLEVPDLSPQSIAHANGVSVRYLNKLFELEDCSLSRWIWRERTKMARNRIGDRRYLHLTISEIAYSCGFNSDAHFNRAFKTAFDITPGEYRQNRSHT